LRQLVESGGGERLRAEASEGARPHRRTAGMRGEGAPHQPPVADEGLHSEGGGGSGGLGHATIDLVEEYALLIAFGLAVAYFVYVQARRGMEAVSYELKSRKAEDDVRRAREAQQARFWEETAEKRAELERIAEERRKAKLEDMEAAAEGRTSKNKRDKPKDTRDYWDGKDGMGFGSGGGGSKTFKPSGFRRRGG